MNFKGLLRKEHVEFRVSEQNNSDIPTSGHNNEEKKSWPGLKAV